MLQNEPHAEPQLHGQHIDEQPVGMGTQAAGEGIADMGQGA